MAEPLRGVHLVEKVHCLRIFHNLHPPRCKIYPTITRWGAPNYGILYAWCALHFLGANLFYGQQKPPSTIKSLPVV